MPVRPRRREIPEDIRDDYANLNISYKKAEEDLSILNAEREEILRKALEDIDGRRVILQTKLDKLKRAMDALYPQSANPYDKNGSWKEKIMWVFKEVDRLIPASVIIGKIRMNENNFESDLAPVIRLTIRRMEAKGEIIKIEDPNLNGKHYALPEWFDDVEELKLKETYYY